MYHPCNFLPRARIGFHGQHYLMLQVRASIIERSLRDKGLRGVLSTEVQQLDEVLSARL